jgi:hypothetical protein
MRPLGPYLEIARQLDVVATSLSWKHYSGFKEWQPKKIPMVMSGVVFFNDKFKKIYRQYVNSLACGAGKYFMGDQYVFSTVLEMEAANLAIGFEPYLQVDAMNFSHHFGCNDYPLYNGVLDLNYNGLNKFSVFHYNGPYKKEYKEQMREFWALPEYKKKQDLSSHILVPRNIKF